jgi:Xaa-Pro aminopeptidase
VADTTIIQEKTEQAVGVLDDLDIDIWLIFARETNEVAEPSLPLVLDEEFIWPGMVIITNNGDSVVICESHDTGTMESVGVHDVEPYVESLAEVFLETLQELSPSEIAVNYAEGNSTADGLSHGLYRWLEDTLEGTEFEGSLTSADPVVSRVRGAKSTTELNRIQNAVDAAEDILTALRIAWEPEWTERDVHGFVRNRVEERGLSTAWSSEMCPVVTAGADADHGHTKAGERTVPPGEVLRLDFGVEVDGYVSDMQRLFYHAPRSGEGIPDALQSAFTDVRDAIHAGFDALEPGVVGHEVDAAARSLITERGWPEFAHGLGHQVGQSVHDGGTYLGPRWERYMDTPFKKVHKGEVFTLELGIETEWGYLAQEEMVHVTEDGAVYLTNPQEELWTLNS